MFSKGRISRDDKCFGESSIGFHGRSAQESWVREQPNFCRRTGLKPSPTGNAFLACIEDEGLPYLINASSTLFVASQIHLEIAFISSSERCFVDNSQWSGILRTIVKDICCLPAAHCRGPCACGQCRCQIRHGRSILWISSLIGFKGVTDAIAIGVKCRGSKASSRRGLTGSGR